MRHVSWGGNNMVVPVTSSKSSGRQHVSKGFRTVLPPVLALFYCKLSKINEVSIFHSRG